MGEMVHFPFDSGNTTGYLATPNQGSGPGVVVIQEWWGLVDHIKDVCDRFADEGFVALAPDVYHGKTTKSPNEAGKLMMALRIDEAERDLGAAVEYLLTLDSTTSKKIGIVGFCMGGALALYTATKNQNIGACVVFYGIHPKVKPDLPNLNGPVLGVFGERDGSVPPDVVHNLERQVKDLGKQIEVKIYPGADHAFFNDTRPEVYKPEAATDAWQRTIAFLRQHLSA
ncbi:MAG TPA: alpha/beta family hydrolase [Pyrinomonadaceae bacterium]|jgi:carboxymethylenebutenolidase|nr:alpha/beta family hydrolase [Pyrinomonadaceae bacterium]